MLQSVQALGRPPRLNVCAGHVSQTVGLSAPVQGVYPGQGVLCYQGVIGPEADAALAAVAAVLPASSDEASKEFVKEYQKRKRAGSNSASGSGSGSDEASHISGPLRVVATVDSRA